MNLERLLRRVHLDYVVLVLSILALVGWGIGVAQWRGYTECQAEVNDKVIQVLTIRSTATDAEREAEAKTDRAFLAAMNVLLAQPPKTRQERLEALATLQRALDEQEQQRIFADKVREENPIPELPSRSCQ